MKLRLLFSCIALISLSGCDSGTPKCNSNEAKNLVVDIATKEAAKTYYKLDGVTISVENVRTVEHQSKLDVYQCAADLKFANAEKANSIPITYRIQKTDDNNGQFYINVFGL